MFKKLIAMFALVSMLSLGAVQTAHAAFDPFGGACSNEASSSTVCQDKINGGNPVTNTLQDATNIIALVTGIAAVIMIIVNGIKYVISTGDPAKVNSAKDGIIYAVVGLVV